MGYCMKCGKEIEESAAFCGGCGAPVESQVSNTEFDAEEREFLENTHNLLRWERTAWSITSKVLIIVGIVYAALFMLFSLIGMFVAIGGESFAGGMIMGIYFVYAIIFGGMFIALGIVNKKAADKIPQYLDTVYTDFSLTYNRCGNVGMLVFSVLLGEVSPVFFIINFVRMKSNRAVIERIMHKQNVQG